MALAGLKAAGFSLRFPKCWPCKIYFMAFAVIDTPYLVNKFVILDFAKFTLWRHKV